MIFVILALKYVKCKFSYFFAMCMLTTVCMARHKDEEVRMRRDYF